MKRLTVSELKEICKKHKYVLLQFESGYLMGVNCKISPLSLKQGRFHDNQLLPYVSYIPCDFMTYISFKNPFISK